MDSPACIFAAECSGRFIAPERERKVRAAQGAAPREKRGIRKGD